MPTPFFSSIVSVPVNRYDALGLRNGLEVNEKQAAGWTNVRMLELENNATLAQRINPPGYFTTVEVFWELSRTCLFDLGGPILAKIYANKGT